MAAIIERAKSRGGTVGVQRGDRELLFTVKGTEDEADVEALVEGTIPAFFRGLIFQDYELEPKGGGLWDVVVRYGPREIKEAGDSEFTFEIGGGTKHISHSLKTMNKYAPAGETAPDFKGAIGVDDDGVKGVDVPDATFSFTEKHIFRVDQITPAYVAKLYALYGRKNKEAWTSTPFYPGGQGMQFAAGEARFMGASGAARNQEEVELTFKFEGSPNASNLKVDTITGIVKRGWDYLWVLWRNAVSQSTRVKEPAAVYVEEVVEDGDFNELVPPP